MLKPKSASILLTGLAMTGTYPRHLMPTVFDGSYIEPIAKDDKYYLSKA